MSVLRFQRFSGNPIIRPVMDSRMGTNVNGPSLIRIPDWIAAPLGQYYLYFAHHDGDYIRLAYADQLYGPWRMHEAGVLPLADSCFAGHIASPDVHVDHIRQEIRLYYHGSDSASDMWSPQYTRVAVSSDGRSFDARTAVLGEAYFRVFTYHNCHYALAMPGILYRSEDGLSNFQQGPTLFDENMRHSAVCVHGDTLHVYYSNAGDCPESILHATVDLSADWSTWRASEAQIVLQPECPYEGADLPLVPSRRGMAAERRRELRDPAIYTEGDRTWLLYAVAGESGIAIAELGSSETTIL